MKFGFGGLIFPQNALNYYIHITLETTSSEVYAFSRRHNLKNLLTIV